jgi:hypothetical protein
VYKWPRQILWACYDYFKFDGTERKSLSHDFLTIPPSVPSVGGFQFIKVGHLSTNKTNVNPIYILGIIALVLIFLYLLTRWVGSDSSEPELNKRVTITGLEGLNKAIAESLQEESDHSVGDHLDHLDHVTARLSHDVEHNDVVLGLILDHLGLEHDVQPTRDVLVKKPKERSA